MRARLVSQVSAVALAAIATGGFAAIDTAHAIPAGSMVFTFNSLDDCTSGGTNCNNAAVQTYMNSVIDSTYAPWGVTVNGTAPNGAMAERNYTGDDHVVGLTVGTGYTLPTTVDATKAYNTGGSSYQLYNSTTNVLSLTLGNTDGFVESSSSGLSQLTNANTYSSTGVVGHLTTLDSFIVNDTNASPDKTTIALAFTGGLKISQIEFDYEIFPDGSCLTISCSSGVPDLTLKYKDKNGVIQTVVQFLGETPDGDTKSPISGRTTSELTPQLLSHALYNLDGATELYFQDWPATIGIDNLKISWDKVPEPATFAIFGFGLAGFGWVRRRRLAAARG